MNYNIKICDIFLDITDDRCIFKMTRSVFSEVFWGHLWFWHSKNRDRRKKHGIGSFFKEKKANR